MYPLSCLVSWYAFVQCSRYNCFHLPGHEKHGSYSWKVECHALRDFYIKENVGYSSYDNACQSLTATNLPAVPASVDGIGKCISLCESAFLMQLACSKFLFGSVVCFLSPFGVRTGFILLPPQDLVCLGDYVRGLRIPSRAACN